MAEPYRKGEYVRYSCNGVCLVDDIRMDTLGKEAPKEFYILKPVSNPASTIFVPTASQALVDRMARLPNQEELDQLILSTRDKEIPWIEDRKVRLASFQAIIKTCDLRDLICLAVCLYQRQRTLSAVGKKLGSSDETILHRTEALIENQVSFVLQVSTDQVSGYIREKLTPDPHPDLPHTGLPNKQPPRRFCAGAAVCFSILLTASGRTPARRTGRGRAGGSRR